MRSVPVPTTTKGLLIISTIQNANISKIEGIYILMGIF